MQTWFTADTHFDDARMIRTGRRPYSSTRKMNEDIVKRHNSIVKSDDIVFHLGDVFVKSRKTGLKWFDKLNGRFYLIKGNHDWKLNFKNHIVKAYDGPREIEFNSQRIILSHEPMLDDLDEKTWNLFGHTHGVFPEIGNRLDVGLDCHDFYPISFDQVSNLIKQNLFQKLFRNRKHFYQFLKAR